MTPEVPPTAPPPLWEDRFLSITLAWLRQGRTPAESSGPRGDQYNTGESERRSFSGFYWSIFFVLFCLPEKYRFNTVIHTDKTDQWLGRETHRQTERRNKMKMLKKYNSNAVTVSHSSRLVNWPLSKSILVLMASEVRFLLRLSFQFLYSTRDVISMPFHAVISMTPQWQWPSLHASACVCMSCLRRNRPFVHSIAKDAALSIDDEAFWHLLSTIVQIL